MLYLKDEECPVIDQIEEERCPMNTVQDNRQRQTTGTGVNGKINYT